MSQEAPPPPRKRGPGFWISIFGFSFLVCVGLCGYSNEEFGDLDVFAFLGMVASVVGILATLLVAALSSTLKKD